MNRFKDIRGLPLPTGWRADLAACAVLSLICAAISAITGIHGEFPLSDDWAYVQAVQNLVETGSLERAGWTWVPMIPHAAVGWWFSLAFGFSFETLRLSTVLLGWAGVLGTYVLCRQVGLPALLAFLGAAVIALNPLHVNLCHTFMTDVPFATVSTWSLAFLCRGFAKQSWAWIALGTLLAEVAVLSRQPGLAIPIALVIVLVVTGPFRGRHLVASAVTAALTAFVYFVVPSLIMGPQDSGGVFGFSSLAVETVLNPYILWNIGVSCLAHLSYLGVLLSPAILGFATSSRAVHRRLLALSLVLTILAAVVIQAYSGRLGLPLGINMIYDLGLGPVTLHGAELLPRAGAGIWWILTVLGLFAGFYAIGALLSAAWEMRHEYRNRADCLLLTVLPLIFFPPIIALSRSFDRYLLPMLPPLIALLLLRSKESRRMLSATSLLRISALVVMGVYAVVGTRDYLEHHRSRRIILNELMGRGIESSDIDGGFEFNCWHDFTKVERKARDENESYQFVVSYGEELEGYHAIRTLAWRRLLPPGEQVITVFEVDK